MEFDNLHNELVNIGEYVRDKYKNDLKSNNHYATGKLFNSIEYKLTVTESSIKLYFVAADYWIFIEEGRSPGRMPPVDVIEHWMVNKKIPGGKSTAYKIARSIGMNGTMANPYLRQIKQELVNNFKDDIEKALSKDVKIELNKIKEKHNNK